MLFPSRLHSCSPCKVAQGSEAVIYLVVWQTTTHQSTRTECEKKAPVTNIWKANKNEVVKFRRWVRLSAATGAVPLGPNIASLSSETPLERTCILTLVFELLRKSFYQLASVEWGGSQALHHRCNWPLPALHLTEVSGFFRQTWRDHACGIGSDVEVAAYGFVGFIRNTFVVMAWHGLLSLHIFNFSCNMSRTCPCPCRRWCFSRRGMIGYNTRGQGRY